MNNRNFESSHPFCKENIKAIARILNISEDEVEKNKHLFAAIDPYMGKCIRYLAQIDQEPELKVSAASSLDYIAHFKQSAFE